MDVDRPFGDTPSNWPNSCYLIKLPFKQACHSLISWNRLRTPHYCILFLFWSFLICTMNENTYSSKNKRQCQEKLTPTFWWHDCLWPWDISMSVCTYIDKPWFLVFIFLVHVQLGQLYLGQGRILENTSTTKYISRYRISGGISWYLEFFKKLPFKSK